MGDIVEVVLQVIANACRDGKIGPQPYAVFENSGHRPFEKGDVALSALHQIGERTRCLIVRKAPERVSASLVGEIVEAATADVRHVNSELNLLLARRIGDDIGSVDYRN